MQKSFHFYRLESSINVVCSIFSSLHLNKYIHCRKYQILSAVFTSPHNHFPGCILLLLNILNALSCRGLKNPLAWIKTLETAFQSQEKHHFQSYDIIKTCQTVSECPCPLHVILKCHLDLLHAQITLWLSRSQASQNPFRWESKRECKAESTSKDTTWRNKHSQSSPQCDMRKVLIYSLLACTWITLYRELFKNIQ